MLSPRSAIFAWIWRFLEYVMPSINRQGLIEIDPEKLSETPVFCGTRASIQNLFDCLEAG
jgi:uncharacterized protein (DUF433 family)